jgi:uncharacterized protein
MEIQYNPLKYPLYVMAKPVGSFCNLSCDYCYYLEKTDRITEKPGIMNDEILELFIMQQIEAQPGKKVLFTWHGGEPLTLGTNYFNKIISLQKKYKKDKIIDNSIQTNGILLNDEWCEFFSDNNFLVGLSLDGPHYINDYYRKHSNGDGSFNQIINGLDLLNKHNIEYNILSVVNNHNVKYPLEIYRFFKSIGAKYIQFTPVVEKIDAKTGLLVSPEQTGGIISPWTVPAFSYGKFLCDIFDEWINGDIGKIFVTNFDATLACHLGLEPGICTNLKTCGHSSIIETNGDLYSCDHFVFEKYKLGNIREKTITEMMLNEKQMTFGYSKFSTLPDKCLECQFLNLCYGECPKNRIKKYIKDEKPLNYLCPGLKHYYSHTWNAMKNLAYDIKNQGVL